MTRSLLAATFLLAVAPAFAGEWRAYVVTSAEDWKAVCAANPEIVYAQEPRVDFSKEMLVLVVGAERSRAGYKVELELFQDPIDATRLTVFYRETPPARSEPAATVLTRPYAYRRVPRSYKTVGFEPNRKLLHTETPARVERWLRHRTGAFEGLE